MYVKFFVFVCLRLLVVHCGVLGRQLCLGEGGLQRDQEQQGDEETDRLHGSSGTAQGSVLLSRELSATLIILSEDPQSGEKSFILGFLVKTEIFFFPFT